MVLPVGLTCFTKGLHAKSPIISTKQEKKAAIEKEKNQKNEKEKEKVDEEKKKSKSEVSREKKREITSAEGKEVPYLLVPSKKDKEQHLARFLDIFKKLEITLPFGEALQQMPLFAKFFIDDLRFHWINF